MGNSSKILIIDDDEIIRTLAMRILMRAGHDVETADSGAAGLKAFSADPDSYAMVLIDENMSGMNGQETLGKFRNIRPGFPCLLSSGYTIQKSDILPELQENTWVLGKPYKTHQLREAVSLIVLCVSGKN